MTECKDYIIKVWGDAGKNVVDVIDQQDIKAMTGDEFLSHCTACGGNWGGMFLTGIKALYPEVYEMIPLNMGKHAFEALCTILTLLQVDFGGK